MQESWRLLELAPKVNADPAANDTGALAATQVHAGFVLAHTNTLFEPSFKQVTAR